LQLHNGTKGLRLKIDRQLTKLDNFATTTPDRQRPTVAAGCQRSTKASVDRPVGSRVTGLVQLNLA
jgi:hypothetical protein